MTAAEFGPPRRTAQDMAELVAAETTAGERVPVEQANSVERRVDTSSVDPVPALLLETDDPGTGDPGTSGR